MTGNALVQWGKRVLRANPTGQVTADSDLGRWITHLSSLESVTSIVEIGTWRGNGTTRRIADGLARRGKQNARAICLEFNRDMASEAATRYTNNTAISVIWGRLVDSTDLDDTDLTDEEATWLQSDLSDLDDSPVVWDQIPSRIDLLILDGGEFSTLPEYLALKDRVRGWIALDDTRTRKCREIVRRIEEREDVEFVVADQSAERNGVMILRRVI